LALRRTLELHSCCPGGALHLVRRCLQSRRLLNWINTLFATLLSVFAALVIGLVLFRHQSRETDRKKKDELTRLLRSELLEVK
jgi:Tfp pilus assembly protein PilN